MIYTVVLHRILFQALHAYVMRDSPVCSPKCRKETSPEKPTVRGHSVYCQATGPIVEEGFVAARIQTLQLIQNESNGRLRSHSPMTPCHLPFVEMFEAKSHQNIQTTPMPLQISSRRWPPGTVERHTSPNHSRDYYISTSNTSSQGTLETPRHVSDNAQTVKISKTSASSTPLSKAGHDKDPSADNTIASESTSKSNMVLSSLHLNANPLRPLEDLSSLLQSTPDELRPSLDIQKPTLRPDTNDAARLDSMVGHGLVGSGIPAEFHVRLDKLLNTLFNMCYKENFAYEFCTILIIALTNR